MQSAPSISTQVIIQDAEPFFRAPEPIPPPPVGPVIPDPPGPAGFGAFNQDFVATANQTSFLMLTTPADVLLMLMIVDHLTFYPAQDFTLLGNIVTWNAAANFPMVAGQDVRIYYT